MSNMIDLLLGASDAVLERPEDEFEVSRLTKILGQRFAIKAHALTMPEFDEIKPGIDRPVHIVLKAALDPDFTSEALRKKYTPEGRKTPLTPVELMKKLLLPGEIINLYNAVSDLSGFGDDAVAKIEKN
jgi:hypothetical protein